MSNQTMHPVNKYGVPLVDVMNYPTRSASSQDGTYSFYIRKRNQPVYVVATKMKAVASAQGMIATINIYDRDYYGTD